MSSLGTRKGLTLLEVLITIFVMGIGMLSVLTLFPLAARKIGMSIDMDRATQMAANASALASLPMTVNGPTIRQKVQQYFDGIESGYRSTNPLDPRLARPSEVMHYDVAAKNDNKTTSLLGTLIPLAGWPYLNRYQVVSLDEYPFTDSGAPEANSRRSERYSCSYLFRRGRLDDETSMETIILVYAGRPFDFGVGMETNISSVLAANANPAGSMELSFTNLPVQGPGGPDRVFHRGSWIMDKDNWKLFYKVVSVDSSTNKVAIDRALEKDLNNAVWIDYLVDWFDRGTAP
jgi:prepilin-type N-terminal cleavage/methylation domain-containing protein